MTTRYAIIGSGMMGQEHIRNIALLSDTIVTAVVDPHEGMRAQAAELAGPQAQAFADPKDLYSAGLADVLVIASPNHTHHAVLLDALTTGLPILVEKPLATTEDDCRALVAAARGRAAPVWVAMEYRYMAPIARLLEQINAGTAGRPVMVSIHEHRFPFLGKIGDWNRFSRNTGGTLVEKCCHFFDLMRLILKSEPVRVYASGGQDVNHLDERYDGETPDIIDNAFITVDFASGARASLELSMFAEGSWFQETVTAIGDKAKIEARVPGPARFWPGGAEREADLVISPRDPKGPVRQITPVDPTILAAGDHHGATFFQHQRLLDLVRGGGAPEVTLDDGMKAVAIGAAAERSIRDHQPQTLSF